MTREQADTRQFVSILAADGTFRQSVPEGTEGSVVRHWEMGGDKGVKYELSFKALKGLITKIELVDTKFDREGKKVTVKFLQVTIKDDEGELVISTPSSSNFAQSMMKQFPNMDFSKEYRLAPYSFIGDTGKDLKGVNITLEGNKDAKVENFFYDEDKKVATNGFPKPKGDTEKYTTNKWKSYFGEIEDFLIGYTEKNIIPKLQEEVSIETSA